MNLNCLICSDLFTPDADIRTPACGHLFHYHCLTQWLRRSQTCPQCRKITTIKSIRKIYLNAAESTETLDTGVLQTKIDTLQLQINLKEETIKIVNEKYENARKQTVGLREQIKTQEHSSRVLKEEIAYLKSKSKDCDKLEEEIGRLTGQFRDMEHVQNKLVANFCNLWIDSDIRVEHTQARLKKAQNASKNYKTELSRLNKNYNRLQQEIEAYKLESEIQKKVDDLASKFKTESGDPLNPSIRRIIPPLPKLTQLKNESFNKDTSPSIPEKVQAIEDSDSPCLQAQSSVVGYSHLGKHIWMSKYVLLTCFAVALKIVFCFYSNQ